jgi:hypothetical protein
MFSKTENKARARSLSFRLASRFTAVAVVSHIVASLVLYFVLSQGVVSKDRKIVRARFEEIALLVERNDVANLQKDLADDHDLLVRVTGATGRPLFERLPERTANFDISQIYRAMDKLTATSGQLTVRPAILGEETIEMTSGTLPSGDRLVVGINTDDSEDILHLFIKAAVISVIIATLFSLFYGYL